MGPAVLRVAATPCRAITHLIYNNGAPTAVRQFNTPANPKNIAHVLGFFVQDAWSIASRLTLNLGMRYDQYSGILPGAVEPGRHRSSPARSIPETEADQPEHRACGAPARPTT